MKELLTEWEENEEGIVCNYTELQTIMKFLLFHETLFKISYPSRNVYLIQHDEYED